MGVRLIERHPESKVASGSATEWDSPLTGWGPNESGEVGTTSTISYMLKHDPGGQLWLNVTLGSESLYIRPNNLSAFASALYRSSLSWSQCHWDIDLDSCISKTCLHGGSSHIGRVQPWEQTRTRRVKGAARDPEILRLWNAGLTRLQIAVRVGWSTSTVSKVIREASR